MFYFPVTGETLTTAEVCEKLATNYSIKVEPSQLEDSQKSNPDHDFFKQLEKWPWKMAGDIARSNEIAERIREAANELGFSVEDL